MPTDREVARLARLIEETINQIDIDECSKLLSIVNAKTVENFIGELDKTTRNNRYNRSFTRSNTGSLKDSIDAEALRSFQSMAAVRFCTLLIKKRLIRNDDIPVLRKISEASDNLSMIKVLMSENKFKTDNFSDLNTKNFPPSFANDVAEFAHELIESLIKEQIKDLRSDLMQVDDRYFNTFNTLPYNPNIKTDADLEKSIRDCLFDNFNNVLEDKDEDAINLFVKETKESVLHHFCTDLKARAAESVRACESMMDASMNYSLADSVMKAQRELQRASDQITVYELDPEYKKAKGRRDELISNAGNYLASYATRLGATHVPEANDKPILDHMKHLETIRKSAQRDLSFFTAQKERIELQTEVAKHAKSAIDQHTAPHNYEKLKQTFDTIDRVNVVKEREKTAMFAKLARNKAIILATQSQTHKFIIQDIFNMVNCQGILSPKSFALTVLAVTKDERSAVENSIQNSVRDGYSGDRKNLAARYAAENENSGASCLALPAAFVAAVNKANSSDYEVNTAATAVANQYGLHGNEQRLVSRLVLEAANEARDHVRRDRNEASDEASDDGESLSDEQNEAEKTLFDVYTKKYAAEMQAVVAVLKPEKATTGYIREEFSQFKTSIVRGVVDLAAEAQRVIGALHKGNDSQERSQLATGRNVEGATFEYAALKGPQDYKITTGALNHGVLYLAEDTRGTIYGLSQINSPSPLKDKPNNGEKEKHKIEEEKYRNDLIKEAFVHARQRLENHKEGEEITIFTRGKHDPQAAMMLHAALLSVAKDMGMIGRWMGGDLKIVQRVHGCALPRPGLFGRYHYDDFIAEQLGPVEDTTERSHFKERMLFLKNSNKNTDEQPNENEVIDIKSPKK